MAQEEVKFCPECGEIKPLTSEYWHRNRRRATGYQDYCKPCVRERNAGYMRRKRAGENPLPRRPRRSSSPISRRPAATKTPAKPRSAYPSSREALRRIVAEFKSQPCTDCGNTYPPHVMHCDHVRGDKVMGINKMVRKGVAQSTLREELDKCEVRCATCHYLRHGEGKREFKSE